MSAPRCGVAFAKPRLELPARFCDSGEEACGCVFAKGDAREAEAAEECAAAAGDCAAIDDAGGAGVSGEHGECYVVFFSLQLVPEV